MLPERNPYPADYRPAFACSLVFYPLPHQGRLRGPYPKGRQRAYHVPPMYLRGLGRASPPVARHLRTGSSEPRSLATYLLVPACQPLRLVINNGV
jgi:hypothetical protein